MRMQFPDENQGKMNYEEFIAKFHFDHRMNINFVSFMEIVRTYRHSDKGYTRCHFHIFGGIFRNI